MASTKDVDSDGGSFTPSDGSDSDERSDRDSDYGSDDENTVSKSTLNIQWTGYAKKTPIILFNAESIFNKRMNMRTVGERYHMAYKFGNSECKIVRNIFNAHGFHEVHPNSSDYNLVWTGAHLKPFTLRSLTEFQKINHFPRSYELTRKDRLFKNIQRMQQVKGFKHFDIVPNSFVLPGEYQEFCTAFLKDKGPWIVKPVASSRGRGIFLVNHPDQIPLDENIIVSRYLSNPLLIDGFKFDVRLYVAVTSYDPLTIYLFEEGLTRFATVKYEKSHRHMRNQCMHLTNYSVNKKNEEYVRNDDADVEDYGNKWSLGAMLRYLRSNGRDTAALMMKIEDVIIKTLISVELPIATACKMFMPFRGNCFAEFEVPKIGISELYGFDILIDDNLKPWVLEVNLSPSLACDSPLDMKIKGNMLCDLFSLTGIVCHDPMMRTMQQSRRNIDVASKMAARAKKQRPSSAGSMKKGSDSGRDSQAATSKSMAGLNSEEIRVLRRMKEEESRKGGWVRIFPTADSWDLYSSFLQFTTTHNVMIHQKLYPERHKSISTSTVMRGSTSAGSRAKSAYIQLANNSVKPTAELAAAYAQALLRTKRYERKLGNRRCRNRRRRRNQSRKEEKRKLVQGVAEDSGEENEEQEEENEDDEVPITERNISEKNNQLSQKNLEVQNKLEKGAQKIKSDEVIQIVVEKESKPELKNNGRSGGGLASLARIKPDSEKSHSVKLEDNKEETNEFMEPPPPPDSPPPPLPPPEPKYNVVDLLKKGHTLSKVQARTAFAMYLVRVQQRLMTDSASLSQDDVDGLNEQMDLVLRFLKRAAVNLQQPFKVVVPSRKLPLNDRRRILAKQLGDFVHIYNKETEQLRQRRQLERKHTSLRRAESMEGLEDDKFDRFVHTASEAELEEVLTTYTKINKSASIFLGNKTGHESQTAQHIPTTGNSMKHVGATSSAMRQEAQSARRKDNVSESGVPDPKTGWEEVPRAIHSIPTSSSDLRHHHAPSNSSNHGSAVSGPHTRSSPATYSTNSAASYASAVQIYTQKLSTLRPRSASTGGPKQDKQLRNRPASASIARPASAANSTYGSTQDLQDPYNEKVISEALQRLTMRQQARQYSAFNGTSLVPSNSRPASASGPRENTDTAKLWSPVDSHVEKGAGDAQRKLVTMEDYVTKNRPPAGHSQKRVHSAIDIKSFEGQRRKQTNVNLQSANATFNSFIEDTGPNWPNELALAYSQVTGVTPQNYHSPTYSSKQYQILQQQALKQQSKVLLEQSKAKHQAMIAQAHAVQKSLTRPESETMMQMYAPKPPVNPSSRKSTSAHHRMAKRSPEETNLNFQFSSSSKPQVNGAIWRISQRIFLRMDGEKAIAVEFASCSRNTTELARKQKSDLHLQLQSYKGSD